jgi:methionine synthase II (cobalamin-independent)
MTMVRCHSDHVGSLLRPAELLQARETHARGELTHADFKRVEDRAVDHVVALQEAAGCEVVTDGEMRRLSFQSQFAASVDGVGEWDLDSFLWGDWFDEQGEMWHRARPQRLGVVDRLVQRRSLSAEEFATLRGRTQRQTKITLPSPSLFANFWSATRSRAAYPTLDGFLADVAGILCREVRELERLGCTYVQIDAPHYTLLLDARTRAFYESRGWSADAWLARGIELDNAVVDAAPGVTFGFHLCRGNQASRWLVAGDYEPIAGRIFPHLRAQRLLLEYDAPRAGGFEPLRHVRADAMVVLGLVSTKSARLESGPELEARVREAARHVDLERLAISPQCGFASSILGNALGESDEIAKLRLVNAVASAIWG